MRRDGGGTKAQVIALEMGALHAHRTDYPQLHQTTQGKNISFLNVEQVSRPLLEEDALLAGRFHLRRYGVLLLVKKAQFIVVGPFTDEAKRATGMYIVWYRYS